MCHSRREFVCKNTVVVTVTALLYTYLLYNIYLCIYIFTQNHPMLYRYCIILYIMAFYDKIQFISKHIFVYFLYIYLHTILLCQLTKWIGNIYTFDYIFFSLQITEDLIYNLTAINLLVNITNLHLTKTNCDTIIFYVT